MLLWEEKDKFILNRNKKLLKQCSEMFWINIIMIISNAQIANLLRPYLEKINRLDYHKYIVKFAKVRKLFKLLNQEGVVVKKENKYYYTSAQAPTGRQKRRVTWREAPGGGTADGRRHGLRHVPVPPGGNGLPTRHRAEHAHACRWQRPAHA